MELHLTPYDTPQKLSNTPFEPSYHQTWCRTPNQGVARSSIAPLHLHINSPYPFQWTPVRVPPPPPSDLPPSLPPMDPHIPHEHDCPCSFNSNHCRTNHLTHNKNGKSVFQPQLHGMNTEPERQPVPRREQMTAFIPPAWDEHGT